MPLQFILFLVLLLDVVLLIGVVEVIDGFLILFHLILFPLLGILLLQVVHSRLFVKAIMIEQGVVVMVRWKFIVLEQVWQYTRSRSVQNFQQGLRGGKIVVDFLDRIIFISVCML